MKSDLLKDIREKLVQRRNMIEKENNKKIRLNELLKDPSVEEYLKLIGKYREYYELDDETYEESIMKIFNMYADEIEECDTYRIYYPENYFGYKLSYGKDTDKISEDGIKTLIGRNYINVETLKKLQIDFNDEESFRKQYRIIPTTYNPEPDNFGMYCQPSKNPNLLELHNNYILTMIKEGEEEAFQLIRKRYPNFF